VDAYPAGGLQEDYVVRNKCTHARNFVVFLPSAACSLGKWPRALTARRIRAFTDSIVCRSKIGSCGLSCGYAAWW
jgi:hypothetical protein